MAKKGKPTRKNNQVNGGRVSPAYLDMLQVKGFAAREWTAGAIPPAYLHLLKDQAQSADPLPIGVYHFHKIGLAGRLRVAVWLRPWESLGDARLFIIEQLHPQSRLEKLDQAGFRLLLDTTTAKARGGIRPIIPDLPQPPQPVPQAVEGEGEGAPSGVGEVAP